MAHHAARAIDSDQILSVKLPEVIEVLEHRSGVIRAARYKRPLRISDSRTSEWMCSKSS
jgi:hypothetical protein